MGQELMMNNKEIEKETNNNLVSFVVVAKENKCNDFILFVDYKFEYKIFQDVDSSFSREIISEGLVMMRVLINLRNFSIKNFFKDRIFLTEFTNLFFTRISESKFVVHFDEFNSLKNSSVELYIFPVFSFNAFFNSSICSGLGGSSSTGCQSISSQNSQSSSVTSLVFLYRSSMSCFISLTTALATNFGFNSDSDKDKLFCFIISHNNPDYLSFLGVKIWVKRQI